MIFKSQSFADVVFDFNIIRKTCNQIFHYTCCTTPKRVTSWRAPSLYHCAYATLLLLKRWRTVGNTVSNMTCWRFVAQTYRSKGERVSTRPTAGRSTN